MSDYPQAFYQVNRLSRKEHKCCECGQAITPGTKYEYSSGIWDGRPDSFKTCMSCVEIREEYRKETSEEVCFRELGNCISETFCKGFGPREYAEQAGIALERIMVFFPDYYDDELEDDAA